MIKIISWRYRGYYDDSTTVNKVSDYLGTRESIENQGIIAKDLGVSTKTIKRAVKTLKDQGKLIVHRYKDNNFVYMLGEDATRDWNAYEAIEIYKHRTGEVSLEDVTEIPDDVQEYVESLDAKFAYEYRAPETEGKALTFTRIEAKELDGIVDNLFKV